MDRELWQWVVGYEGLYMVSKIRKGQRYKEIKND